MAKNNETKFSKPTSGWKETVIGLIPEDWRTMNLGKICHIKYGKGLPERTRKIGKYPVYGSNGVVYWHERPFVTGPGIVIGRKGSIGKVEFTEKDYWPIDTTFYIEPPKTGCLNLKFLYYQLRAANLSVLGGSDSAVPGLNRDTLASHELIVPSITEQQKIAGLLDALDDKIELNRKMNKTLESLAQAIFKKWFIDDADPSWEVSTLDKIADFLNGLALQKYPPKNSEDSIPVIKIREIKQGVTNNSDLASKMLDGKYIVNDGDILFSWSGSLEVVIWAGGTGALNQHLFKVTSNKYPKWFYYFWLLHHLKNFQEIAADKATTMGHIQRHHLTISEVIVPDADTLIKLDNVMDPIINAIINNNIENRTLSQIRDSLLPRLMSGKIRMKG